MKRVAILGLVVTCLALVGMALAQAGESKPSLPYVVEPGTSSGAGYQLTSLVWRIDAPDGRASGGRYRLLCPAAPGLRGSASSPLVSPPGQAATGSGCCCTYLPLVVRNLH